MKFLLWLVLLVLSWPIALLALVVYPIVWLVALPFRILGVGVTAILDLVGNLIRAPGRLLAGRRD